MNNNNNIINNNNNIINNSTNTNKNFIFCNNCGKGGHLYHQCKTPITSVGIITVRSNNSNLEYLLIRRKDSLGYIDFLRGKYNINSKHNINS